MNMVTQGKESHDDKVRMLTHGSLNQEEKDANYALFLSFKQRWIMSRGRIRQVCCQRSLYYRLHNRDHV